jgi:D,D-heptose 1,7-bisphosphate phosphatase
MNNDATAMRAVFLDKDGTLVENIPYNADPARVVLCAGVPEGLLLLQRCGYALIVISNQPGIAKGYFSEQDLYQLERCLVRLLREHGVDLRGFYYCPHDPSGTVQRYATLCTCRKPMPGLLLQAAHEHGIDCSASWMVGDILNDIEAGRRAGCKTVLIDNGNETEWDCSAMRSPDMFVDSFFAAAKAIVDIDRAQSGSSEEAMRQ